MRWSSLALLLLACGGSAPAPQSGASSGGGGSASASGPSDSPVAAAGPGSNVTQLALGDFHSCALMADKTVRCWGRNRSGELGDAADGDRSRPAQVAGVAGVEQIAMGSGFSCARLGDGAVWCWGTGRILGDGKLVEKAKPTKVPGVVKTVELRAGGYVVCARDVVGAVKCWGLEAVGSAGVGAKITGAKDLGVAAAHACAHVTGDVARCWGEGVWDPTASPTFGKPAVSGVEQVDTGDSFACALLASHSVVCWGRNDQGELGAQPDEDNHVTPQTVAGVQGATALASAESHTCALVAGGKVVCWGSNTEGELGRGSQTTSEMAAEVSGISGVVEVDVGADHACARTKSDVFCWGANRSGQVGDGTTERRTTPAKVAF